MNMSLSERNEQIGHSGRENSRCKSIELDRLWGNSEYFPMTGAQR